MNQHFFSGDKQVRIIGVKVRKIMIGTDYYGNFLFECTTKSIPTN